MVAVPHVPASAPVGAAVSEERRILLSNVPWSTYVVLRDSAMPDQHAALRAFRDELRAR